VTKSASYLLVDIISHITCSTAIYAVPRRCRVYIFSPTAFVLSAAACLLVYCLYASLATRLRAIEADLQMRLNRLETLLTRVLDVPAPGPSRRLEHLITKLVDSTEQRRQHGRNAMLPKPCSQMTEQRRQHGRNVILPKPCSQMKISSDLSDRCSHRTVQSANGDAVPLATLKTPIGKLFFPPRTVPTNGPGRVSSCNQPVPARPASVPQVAAIIGSSRGRSVELNSQPRRPAAAMLQASATSLPGSSSSFPAQSKQFTVTVEEALRMLETFEPSGTLNYLKM